LVLSFLSRVAARVFHSFFPHLALFVLEHYFQMAELHEHPCLGYQLVLALPVVEVVTGVDLRPSCSRMQLFWPGYS